ncbi:MAG: polysaccharide deacetylase family protein [Candidatus Cloacimonadaceae bacterium]|nr:polysaccharide deacetylase family protein [Candidatus Cloacimonadaceae bacterium]MDP3113662.1 polysaccharide deacetylase family protein [Candidatus Cloacimonadaceae bacterium]
MEAGHLRMWRNSHRVLYYHQIGDKRSTVCAGGISQRQFEAQIRFLSKAGFRFVSLSEAIQDTCGKKPTISITTDDGLSCNHEFIFPILKKYRVPLTMFLIGKCIDNRAMAWNHKLLAIRTANSPQLIEQRLFDLKDDFKLPEETDLGKRLFGVEMEEKDAFTDVLWKALMQVSQEEFLAQNKPFLTLEQVKELCTAGTEIGSHSFSHPDFSRLSFGQMKLELDQTDEVFRSLAIPMQRLFSFPYGRLCKLNEMHRLAKDANLGMCCGGRFKSSDNQPGNLLWQRQKMELSPFSAFGELLVKPPLRYLKDRYQPERDR